MPLDSEHWEQLQALFHLVESTPDAEVDTVLLQACGDPDLRHRAAILIRSSREPIASLPPPPCASSAGTIGPYTVLRHLGSGGIGSVYLVERTTAGAIQKSALKVLTRSAAGPFFTERFAREQHILASLDHPNITRLLDAGFSDEGEPYLTMEYVDGVHLDAYCDDHALGIRERLQLFVTVCEAVAYAHRSLVVHLDLKPSNILVSGAGGTVKLLDFGTSKLIQPDSLLTTTVMATPAYASPEQLLNEPVTTVCDVYALGAILFELLSGRRPNQDSSVAVMIERSLKELPPESVTAAVTAAAAEHRGLTETRLRSVLTGDLATIVAKCINPRPKDRYVTVDALIADVQRYLAGRPILARPQTTTYRLGKFVRRNRSTVVVGSLMVCCLLAVGGYAAWKREQAYREGQRALQMQTFMSELFKLANPRYTGKPTATVPEFLQLGVKLLPEFITNYADRSAARLSLARSLFYTDDLVAARPVFAEIIRESRRAGDLAQLAEADAYAGTIAFRLGETGAGSELFAESLRLDHAASITPSARVRIIGLYGINRTNRGIRTPEDEQLLRSAVVESRHLPEQEQAWILNLMADYLVNQGQLVEAKTFATESLHIYEREPYALCDQAELRTVLANIQSLTGDSAGSVAFYRRANADFRACSGEMSENTLATQALLGRALLKSGLPLEAIAVLEPSLPVWRKAWPASPEIILPLNFLSKAYVQTSQFEKAESTSTEALKVLEGKVNRNSAMVALPELLLAKALQGQGRLVEARRHAETSDGEYSAAASLSASEKPGAAEAHQLAMSLSAKP
jgi:serine/threonine protein kinase/tetratricopeptide (TPR) repeat protein